MTTAEGTIELRRVDAGVRWCFRERKRLPHFDVLRDHWNPARRSPYLGPWWSRECSGCGEDHSHFPGCGPL